jgi:hypothetical protein
MITHIYTKYSLEDDSLKIFAKVSKDKITFKPEFDCRDENRFTFIKSDKEKVKKILTLMLEATNLE